MKNRYNTDNSSSKKCNLDKLFDFKRQNSDYKCIYAVINAKNHSYSRIHKDKDNNEVIELHGNVLFQTLFPTDKHDILSFIDKFTTKYDIFNMDSS